jgi:Xaa-Pro aminopeptidase
MLTEAGCRARRERLWNRLPAELDWALITEPAHLIYFANYVPSPFVFNSQNARGALLLGRDGTATLIADNVQEPFHEAAFVTERVMPLWYRCVEAAGNRGALLVAATLERLAKCETDAIACEPSHCPTAIVDGVRAARPQVRLFDLEPILREMRRAKDPDEVTAIRHALKAASAGLRNAMSEIRPGMTEFDAYRLVQRIAGETAGTHILLYGDFVSGERCEKGGGSPSSRRIEQGDLVLLDFSTVINGYRGDFCNTFVVDGTPTTKQRELFDACHEAMQAGERALRAGVPCRDVDAAVRNSLAARKLAERFPHHSGHGVGLGHPEPPYLVPESDETLVAGDVVTLEPGVYVPGIAGMRFERNYLVTETGCESLSDHPIGFSLA